MKVKSLEELFNNYVEICEYSLRRRPATIRSYKEAFSQFQKLMPNIKSPSHLSNTILNEFFKILQTRKRTLANGKNVIGVKDSTIASYWSRLNPYFTWLEASGYIDKNPLRHMKKPQSHYENKPALKRQQIEKLYSTILLTSFTPFLLKRDTAIVSTLFFTGVRKTELLSILIRDVDIQKSVLTIRGKTSKSKRTRYIPINPTLKIHLKEYLNCRKNYSCEYLFVSANKDERITPFGIKHWVDRLKKKSGVKFHLHQLRHTFACNLARNNISLPKLQKLMGHTDLRMTERYVRSLGVEHLVEDVLKLSIDDSI